MVGSLAAPIVAPTADGVAVSDRQQVMGFICAALSLMIFSGWFVITRFSASHEGLLFRLLWGLPFVLFVALGLFLTSATAATSIAPAAMSVFAGIIGWIVPGERQGRARCSGYGAIVLGLICLIGAGAASQGAPSPIGLMALVGAALLWAIYTIIFRRIGLSPVQAAALICAWSAILFLPFYVLLGLSRLSLASSSELGFQIVYQGVFMSWSCRRGVQLRGGFARSFGRNRRHRALAGGRLDPRDPGPRRDTTASPVGCDRHDRDWRCLAGKRPPVRSGFPKRSAWRNDP
jgi:drug/metabolite transporter (DMT)-like permease